MKRAKAPEIGVNMAKRWLSLSVGATLVAGSLWASPAVGQELPPPAVPETVNIEDPIGDANGLNDQGQSAPGHQGENVTPADAGSVSDFSKIWFTNDAETVSVNIVTEAGGPAINGLRFDVYATPGEGTAASSTLGCVRFVAIMAGQTNGQPTTYQGADAAKVFDACNDGTNWFDNGVEAEFRYGELEDGSGFLVITAPKSAMPFLASGQTLSAPSAIARAAYGAEGTLAGAAFTTDNTVVGTDYAITAGIDEPPVKSDPPGKGKKKGCKKGKGKKKGACPRSSESNRSIQGVGGRAFTI